MSTVETIRDVFAPESERREIRDVRERLLHGFFTILAVLGAVPVALGVYTAYVQGQVVFPVIYVVTYLALLAAIVARRRISFAVRGGILVVLGSFFSVAVLVRVGLSGVGIELLCFFVVGASILLGVRVGAGMLLFAAIALAVVGAGIVTGTIPIETDRLLTSHVPVAWINSGIVFLLMTVLLALGPQVLLRQMSRLVDEREHHAAELERANERLRDEVEQRKQAVADRRTSEERFDHLAEMLPETVFETDVSGKLTYVNERGLEVFGYGPEALGRVSALDVLVEKDRALANIMRVIGGELVGLSEYTVMRPDGSTFPVLVRSVPIRAGGEVVGLRGVIVDITERKRLEAQLQQAQKMEAVGTLAGGLAHDFNNLLMGIQGRVSLMLADIVADPREHLLAIEEYVRSASDLTTRLLGFARGGRYQLVPVDIDELVRGNLDLFGRTHKELELQARYGDEACVAEVDRRQIEQVLLNLLVNAWQAMPDRGRIEVETGVSEDEIEGLGPGPFVTIQVRDLGVGMSEQVRERVFEPFFTTREMGRGTGLGLASAWGIVRNHGGTITVESTEGRGTTFTVVLPSSTRAAAKPAPASADSPSRGRGTVLLVDDEQMVLDVCTALLERLGYQVYSARNGERAVELFREHSFDLVILDLIMPHQTGAHVFDALREIRPDARILLASGYSLDGDATQLLERGAAGFLMKPFSLAELSQKLSEVLAT